MDRVLTFVTRPIGRALALTVALAIGLLVAPATTALLASAALAVFGMAGIRVRPTDDFMRNLIAQGLLDPSGGYLLNLVAKAANYVLVAPTAAGLGDPSGTVFTNRGAVGATTFTLPAVTQAMAGMFYDFLGFANQSITVIGPAGATVTFNNAAATSVAMSTAGGKIGGHIRAVCDGTNWYLFGDIVGVTYTVA